MRQASGLCSPEPDHAALPWQLSLPLADQAPIFLHRVDVARGESGGDVDFSVGHALVDLELGDRPSVNEGKKQTAAPLDAQGVEGDPAVAIELKQRTVGSLHRR